MLPEPHAEGVILPVGRSPAPPQRLGRTRRASKVSVTQVAEKGKANLAIVKVLCDQLNFASRRSNCSRGKSLRGSDSIRGMPPTNCSVESWLRREMKH